jgi:hypothetical protein
LSSSPSPPAPTIRLRRRRGTLRPSRLVRPRVVTQPIVLRPPAAERQASASRWRRSLSGGTVRTRPGSWLERQACPSKRDEQRDQRQHAQHLQGAAPTTSSPAFDSPATMARAMPADTPSARPWVTRPTETGQGAATRPSTTPRGPSTRPRREWAGSGRGPSPRPRPAATGRAVRAATGPAPTAP